jgi:hypothetical protein
MSKARFSVTYDIVTPDSAEHGDTDECGHIGQGLTLREAIKELHATRTCRVDGVQAIETDSFPCTAPRWITVTNGMEFETGAHESRALHIPNNVTPASARRIAMLAGVDPRGFQPGRKRPTWTDETATGLVRGFVDRYFPKL